MPQNRFESILETVGRTPVVRIAKLAPPHVRLYVKLEAFNPMGSVKDRLALGVIEDAERRGALRPGQTVIEATSGNTGIGLAMVCARKGYPLVVTMAENFSVERRKLMRFLGAKVVLTPAALKGQGMLAKAVELAAAHGWFLCRQFENEANADIHSRTTAPEILAAFAGERLDYFVTGFGTGGTLKGVGRVLREQSPQHPDHRVRAGQLAGARQRHRPAARRRRVAGRQPPELPPAPDAGLEPGLHTQAHPGRRRARTHRPHRAGERRARAARCPGSSRARRACLVGISGRRDARRRPHGVRGGARRAAPCCACCRIPASAT